MKAQAVHEKDAAVVFRCEKEALLLLKQRTAKHHSGRVAEVIAY